ncbi:hypothetical protein, partial [Delftia deserti]
MASIGGIDPQLNAEIFGRAKDADTSAEQAQRTGVAASGWIEGDARCCKWAGCRIVRRGAGSGRRQYAFCAINTNKRGIKIPY